MLVRLYSTSSHHLLRHSSHMSPTLFHPLQPLLSPSLLLLHLFLFLSLSFGLSFSCRLCSTLLVLPFSLSGCLARCQAPRTTYGPLQLTRWTRQLRLALDKPPGVTFLLSHVTCRMSHATCRRCSSALGPSTFRRHELSAAVAVTTKPPNTRNCSRIEMLPNIAAS
ncbi:unnamed protein product [Protopolystoma xenopodis]|uniref:Uncharacterized protein n=1 Tax=Protopolystoma xenopodis TaxID=117903 RepID=A0A448X692_9PLAT|nr:unnamed protein product [Protopolystoma xenopodis]